MSKCVNTYLRGKKTCVLLRLLATIYPFVTLAGFLNIYYYYQGLAISIKRSHEEGCSENTSLFGIFNIHRLTLHYVKNSFFLLKGK